MMKKKLQHLSITGPKEELDRLIDLYLGKYEFHLENAMTELSSIQKLRPYVEENPYKDALEKEKTLLRWLTDTQCSESRKMSDEEALSVVGVMQEDIRTLEEERSRLKERRAELLKEMELLEHYRSLDCDFKKLRELSYIKYRFGRIPLEYIQKFYLYVYDDMEAVFYEYERDTDYAWGIYFAPSEAADRIDALFSTVHFEKVGLLEEYTGTPEEAWRAVRKEWKEVKEESRQLKEMLQSFLMEHKDTILCAYQNLKVQADYYKVRKMAACINEESSKQVYYVLCGRMPTKDAKVFLREIEKEKNVYCFAKEY